MADVAKLKKTNRLGPPPSVAEASTNLTAPEVAPVAPAIAPAQAAPVANDYHRRDGRSARKTNRTLPLALRVTQAFDEKLRDVAARDGLLLVEVLERALDAYEAQRA